MANINIIEFKCTPIRRVFNGDNFKIYGCTVNEKLYPNVKMNKYGNVTIKGDISELSLDVEYTVKGNESYDNSFGYSYFVENIRRDRPKTNEETKNFLYEILSSQQVDSLMNAYPDIVDRVMNNRLDDIDLRNTPYIKEKTFEKIKEKIVNNFYLTELVEEFHGLFSLSDMRKLYNEYSSVDRIKEKLKEDPYECMCQLDRTGFATADKMLLKLNAECIKMKENGEVPVINFDHDLKSSYQRTKACIEYLITKNETDSGNTYMKIDLLKRNFISLIPEFNKNEQIRIHFVKVLKEDKRLVFDQNSLCVCMKVTYNREQNIASKLTTGLLMPNAKANTWKNIDYKKYKKCNGIELTEQQLTALEYICKYNVLALIGYSGAGKSQTTTAMITMFDDYGITYKLVSPTAKAAKVLKEYTKKDATTVHRGYSFKPPYMWGNNKDNPITEDILIMDESSMADVELFDALINGIDFKRTKLLLIGDPAQLPSVGAGNCLYDLIQSNIIKRVELTKIFRYGVGGISTVATKVRNQEAFLNEELTGTQVIGDDNGYVFINIPQERMVDKLVDTYVSLIKNGNSPNDIMVLTAQNKNDYGTFKINQKIQSRINNSDAMIVYGSDENQTQYRLNDIVMNIKNNYHAKVYDEDFVKLNANLEVQFEEDCPETMVANGEIGVISVVFKDAIVIDFDYDRVVYKKQDLDNLQLGYAMSIHKSQGSGSKIVLMATPKAHTYQLSSNLLYVAITRAKERCIHFGEIDVVHRALKKKDNYQRKTLLGVFIKKSWIDLARKLKEKGLLDKVQNNNQ